MDNLPSNILPHLPRIYRNRYVGTEASSGVEWFIHQSGSEWIARRLGDAAVSIRRRSLSDLSAFLRRA
jgi:hypothetical protein